jgi:hypothetical protein
VVDGDGVTGLRVVTVDTRGVQEGLGCWILSFDARLVVVRVNGGCVGGMCGTDGCGECRRQAVLKAA